MSLLFSDLHSKAVCQRIHFFGPEAVQTAKADSKIVRLKAVHELSNLEIFSARLMLILAGNSSNMCCVCF
jgi:hypothetical protein